MIKVLGLALYGPLAASTRYRLGQYQSGLAKLGIDLQLRYLLGDDYLRSKFNRESVPLTIVIKSGLARLGDLWHIEKYDLAILHCELFPLMPGWLEQSLIRKPYIYDFDDAFYLKYRIGTLGLASPLLANKFDKVLAASAAVTAGNKLLADYAKLHNTSTQYLPTVVDTDSYIPQTSMRDSQIFTVGWIGSPSTAHYLSELAEPLTILGKDGPVRFIVVGGKAPKIPNISVIEIEWDQSTELNLLNSFDVGVMPLIDNAWSRGKCAFKLIQYMACGVPVVASAVGANIDVVKENCGFLVTTSSDWTEALRMLRDKKSARVEMGNAGRERVIQHYSLHKNLPVLANVIINVSKSKS